MSDKRVLFVGFYDDFSRLYHGVSAELNCECHFVFQNLSGYLHSLLRNFEATYLFFSPIHLTKRHKVAIGMALSDEDATYILEYTGSDSRFRKFLIRQLYSFWLKRVSVLGISSLMIAGDSRPISRLFKLVGQELGCEISYFEQGPNNNTILDSSGVNANCSFRYRDGGSYVYAGKYCGSIKQKYDRNIAYRICDYFFDFVFVSLFFPIFAENNIQTRFRSLLLKISTKNLCVSKYDYTDQYVLLILQIPEDANMKLHSPHFDSFTKMLEATYSALPFGFNLIVREHPLYKFSYDLGLYSFIENKSDIFLDSESNLEGQIDSSSLVIVNNSTVGFEAIFLKKKLMVLGDAYYDQYKYLKKLKDADSFSSDLRAALQIEIDESEADSYIAWCFTENFLPGHFRNKDITSLCKRIANKL